MKLLFLFSIPLLLVSCSNNSDDSQSDNQNTGESDLENAVNNNKDSTLTQEEKYKLENTKVEFGEPIILKSTDNVAMPIILEDIHKDKLTVEHHYFNVAIIDKNNEFKKLLFDESVTIYDLFTVEDPVHEYNRYYDEDQDKVFSEEYNSLLFMEVAKFSNGIKSDQEVLYVYNLKEDKLSALTPDGYDVKGWRIYKDVSKMIIRIAPDTDNNGVYDEKDTENVIIVDPNNPTEIRPIFDMQELAKVKLQVLEEN